MNHKNNRVKKLNQSKYKVKIVQKLWICQFHLHIHNNKNNINKFLQNNLLSKEDQKIAYIRRKNRF